MVGNFLLVEQLPLLVVEQLSNPIPLSIRDVMRSLVEVEVICILFQKMHAQLLVVERILNPLLFSIRVSRRSLVEAEVMYAFSYKTCPVFILTTFGIK